MAIRGGSASTFASRNTASAGATRSVSSLRRASSVSTPSESPLRPVVVELERAGDAVVHSLPRLGLDDVAALTRALVATLLNDVRAGIPAPNVPHPLLMAAHWRAAHDGLEGLNIDMATREPRPAWRLMRQLFDYVRPELERHGDLEMATVLMGRLRSHGTGAARQRAILARQAFRDPLTQLGNRAMFMDHATDALADADQTMTAVVLLDLDGFKGVNDTYGHAAGDELLKVTAERLNANVRANDTVSRLGGDEFVVLLPRLVDDAIADTVAGRILRDLGLGDEALRLPAFLEP